MTANIEATAKLMSPYLYAPAAVFVWIGILWALKRLLFGRLGAWAEKTKTEWDDLFIKAASSPLNVFIGASGFWLLERIMTLPPNVDRMALTALRVSFIFALALFFDELIRGVLKKYSAKPVFAQIPSKTVQGISRGLVIGIGVLILLDQLGISITPLLASLGIGSLAVALALQDTLSNLFAGIYIAVDRPASVGDFIKLETGEEGFVAEVGWRSTRLRTLPNNVVVIPNSKLIGSIATNYYLPDREIAVLIQVGVHYASDLAQVERVTIDVGRDIMKTVSGAIASFEPFIRYHTFGDSSINFTVILRCREFVDNYLIKHEFIKRLHERYRSEGIVIPFPIRTLELSADTADLLRRTGVN